MTVSLLALVAALLAWPVSRPGERRLRGLVGESRLARPGRASRMRWRWAAPSPEATGVVAAGVGVLAAVWRGPVLGVAAAVAAAVALSGVARAMRRADARARDRDLSAALRLLRAELDVGSSGMTALSAAASVAGAHRSGFQAMARAVAEGRDVSVAVAEAGGTAQLVAVAQAWQLAATLGAPVAGVLARVDDDVQARRDQARAVATALAGPRSSAALLAGLPVLGVGLGLAMGANPLHVLLDTAGGRLLLGAGVLLDGIGVVWTDWLISSAEGR